MHTSLPQEDRKLWRSAARGFSGKCPNCGEGAVFKKQLTVDDSCTNCGEPLHHHRADDLPAYLNIFLVGHIVVGIMLVVMNMGWLTLWTLTAVAVALALILAVILMRPLKGMVVGVQWALKMHGFGGPNE